LSSAIRLFVLDHYRGGSSGPQGTSEPVREFGAVRPAFAPVR
jgi:hypothetical protein